MTRRKGGRRANRGRLPRRRTFQIFDPQKEEEMSIKGDVLEHLLNHPNEVVSLTALASTLDVTLEQVRGAVSNLRTGAVKQGNGKDSSVGMKEQIRVVSRGYAVKYLPPADEPTPVPVISTPTPADVPKKHVVTTVVDSGSNDRPATVEAVMTDSEPMIPMGVSHPHSDDIEVILGQLGPTAHKVFSYIAQQGGKNVTGNDVVEATGLSRSAVSSAFYNTLFNPKQYNRNARRHFVKVGRDVYRLSVPGDGAVITGTGRKSPYPPTVSDPVTAKIVDKLYNDKETKLSTAKRIFEELRVLPDGSILIEDENGAVYKAREI